MGWLSRNKQPQPQQADPVVAVAEPVITIEEVHEAFRSATRSRVTQLQAQIVPTDARLEGLRALGFWRVPEVQQYIQAQDAAQEARRILEALARWQERYPQNQYITRTDLQKVCHKYNLYVGPVTSYVGGIPRKNQEEILAFKLRDGDRMKERRGEYNQVEEVDAPFLIAAPQDHFEKNRYEFNSRQRMLIPKALDPIVLAPVNDGGYLIVSAWGPEAADPAVVSPGRN